MSRWIDAEYAKAYPIRIDHYDKEHGNRHFVLGIESVIEYLDYAPSIDIVRCGECKWFDTDNTGETYCMSAKGLCDVAADDFCSYGERREP